MIRKFPTARKALTLAVLAGLSMPVAAQQDEEIEEVVVTGSFIRGTPIDAPSPVQVIDRDSIEAQGASAIWDVIRNLEVNQGSDTSVAGSNDAGQLAGTASVNLRNLGGNSTLTLINGKRFTPSAVVTSSGQESVDLNSIPVVMTERIEVLTDGGSALYGSDAVAGVVNVIMRTDFEGLELYTEAQGIAKAGGSYEQTFSGIWGDSFNNGDTRLVLSGEYFERDPVLLENASYFDPERITSTGRVGSFGINSPLGGNINPAYINFGLTGQNIAERIALGETVSGTQGTVFSDPLCETLSGNHGDFFIDNRFSNLGRLNGTCVENTLAEQFIAIGQQRGSFAGSFEHTFGENAEFYSFVQHSEIETVREGSGYTFSRTLHLVPSPSMLGSFGAFLGNTFPEGHNSNNPHTLANGGFNEGYFTGGNTISTGWPRSGEDRITESRTSGAQLGLRGEIEFADRPLSYDVSYSRSWSSVEQQYETLTRDRTERAIVGLGGENCTPNGSENFNFLGYPAFAPLAGLFDIVFPGYILNTRETMSLALTSTNHGQDGCEFFNPYLTSLSNPSLANSPELIDWMTADDILRADKQNKLTVFDAVVTGELFEMTGGTAQFAAGYQHRQRNAKGIAPEINLPGLRVITGYDDNGTQASFVNPFPLLDDRPNAWEDGITNNLECSNCIFNFDDERSIQAVFLELSLPFAENVESQVALRYEDYGGNIGSQVSPKLAVSWRPIEELLLRTSYSQSFRAPNIGVVNQAFEAFGTSVLDPIRNQDVRAGLLPATNDNAQSNSSFTVGAPNPDLGNENADTYNAGFQWTPAGALDGLLVGADVWHFEVEDRVLPKIPRAALNPEIEKFNQAVQNPANFVLNSSIPLDARGPDGHPVSCDPASLEAEFGRDSAERRNCVVNPTAYIVDGVQRNLTSTNAGLITLVLPAVNAGNIQVQGIDVRAGYNWDSEWGQFRVNLDYTHIESYNVNDVPGLELGLQETGVFDAAGVDGEQNIVREVPDNKGTVSFTWMRDNHRVSLFNRHIGSYQILSHQSYIDPEVNPNLSPINRGYAKPKSESYNTWDIQYAYTHAFDNSAWGTANFTMGVIDATNAELPLFRRGSFDASVYDGRGRRWYARVLWQL
ncbi:MAG: TonB-dependent receptor [Gammaproteobacteria bacterium]|nr:TonB-dependent receptor [Gammaproteobacteria bacterium]MYE29463.1 TonB-dependent receptor [Gammaproteobacteria bacterium]MYI02776.1 TonB-dependent receptor [Gammaproteobacteria bacterium]